LTLELAGLCLGLIDGAPRSTPDPAGTKGLRDMTQLPGLIAHELGNRLTTARAGLDLLMDQVANLTAVPTERRVELTNDLRQITNEIERSVQFLRAIRDRARGALARWERFDAARVVQSCCTLEGRVLKDRIALVLDGASEAVYLLGDPNALYDALVNLIRNAADASAGRSGPVRVELERAGQVLRIAVHDRGHGMSAQTLERIFESGFSTKGFGEGGGMGLSVVQDVVQNMFGGTINVDSEVDVGTSITISLPIPAQRGCGADPGAAPLGQP
jgi:signal transduction histidine kinase